MNELQALVNQLWAEAEEEKVQIDRDVQTLEERIDSTPRHALLREAQSYKELLENVELSRAEHTRIAPLVESYLQNGIEDQEELLAFVKSINNHVNNLMDILDRLNKAVG